MKKIMLLGILNAFFMGCTGKYIESLGDHKGMIQNYQMEVSLCKNEDLNQGLSNFAVELNKQLKKNNILEMETSKTVLGIHCQFEQKQPVKKDQIEIQLTSHDYTYSHKLLVTLDAGDKKMYRWMFRAPINSPFYLIQGSERYAEEVISKMKEGLATK